MKTKKVLLKKKAVIYGRTLSPGKTVILPVNYDVEEAYNLANSEDVGNLEESISSNRSENSDFLLMLAKYVAENGTIEGFGQNIDTVSSAKRYIELNEEV